MHEMVGKLIVVKLGIGKHPHFDIKVSQSQFDVDLIRFEPEHFSVDRNGIGIKTVFDVFVRNIVEHAESVVDLFELDIGISQRVEDLGISFMESGQFLVLFYGPFKLPFLNEFRDLQQFFIEIGSHFSPLHIPHIGHAGRIDSLDLQLEIIGIAAPLQRLFQGDQSALVEFHDRLVETLHSVLLPLFNGF